MQEIAYLSMAIMLLYWFYEQYKQMELLNLNC